MEYIGDVFYDYGGSLYVNMTNCCPCRCTFCIRDMVDALGDADSLWLKREPSKEELLTMLAEQKLAVYDEIVFCGYGEPTERLDCLLRPCARDKIMAYLKNASCPSTGGTFTVPLDRNAMAQYLNMDRSALSRELSKMKADEIMDFHKSTFRLLD